MISVSITLIAKEPKSEEAIVLKSTLFLSILENFKCEIFQFRLRLMSKVKGHLAVFLSNESTMFLNYR